jgi:hypothetical protein
MRYENNAKAQEADGSRAFQMHMMGLCLPFGLIGKGAFCSCQFGFDLYHATAMAACGAVKKALAAFADIHAAGILLFAYGFHLLYPHCFSEQLFYFLLA